MTFKVLIFAAAVSTLTFFQAVTSVAQKNPKRLYITDENKANIQIPFKLINNLIVIRLQINNSDTLNFILDTGIIITILDQKDVLKLKLNSQKEYWVGGFGQGNGMLARHSPENEIEISGIIGQHQDLLVMQEDEPNLSNLLGIPIHGLIGYTLFKDFIVEINYDEHYIILHTPRKYVYNLNKDQVTIPLTLVDSKPYIDATVIQENNSNVPVKLMMDLGASHALLLNLMSNSSLQLPAKNLQFTLGVGLSGLLSGQMGRLKELVIGKFKFRNILANYPDMSSLGHSAKMLDRNGSIGSGLLSRFNIIIDYRHQKLVVAPRKDVESPFRYNMSGIEIITPKPGEPFYQISFIHKNSPADKAGLKAGDQITCINDEPVSTLTLSDIIKTFLEQPGKKVIIRYTRDKKEMSTSFFLEEIL
jgi:hypothetical protein